MKIKITLILALLAIPACDAMLPYEATNDPEYLALQADLEEANANLMNAEADAISTYEQYQAALREIDALTEEIRGGTLSAQAAADAAAAVAIAVEKAGDLRNDYDRLKGRVEEVADDYGDIYGRMEAITERHGGSAIGGMVQLALGVLFGGALPTMNIPILNRLVGNRKVASGLELIGLRNEQERQRARTVQTPAA